MGEVKERRREGEKNDPIDEQSITEARYQSGSASSMYGLAICCPVPPSKDVMMAKELVVGRKMCVDVGVMGISTLAGIQIAGCSSRYVFEVAGTEGSRDTGPTYN